MGNTHPENAAQGATDGGGGRSWGLLADLPAPAEYPPGPTAPEGLRFVPPPQEASLCGLALQEITWGRDRAPAPPLAPPCPQRERLRPGARWAAAEFSAPQAPPPARP